ncbi:hypothetical protein EVJ58_g862 [Rhodofomes roseus]|uniref:Solute carrier family 40 member n=1 Tax=Rhodofomes roseus TaxID=34475 RepID=A0A4Y9Z4E0_9APHY|nr:hypothetical protein EVJ58_g862 [Rhodofomes roseus]
MTTSFPIKVPNSDSEPMELSIMPVEELELHQRRSIDSSHPSPAQAVDPAFESETTSPSTVKQQPETSNTASDAPSQPAVTEILAEVTPGTADNPLDRKALILLLVQHFSSSWGSRTAEFAVYLFLITLFPNSLLPASIFGFLTTGSAVVLSGWAGHQVDIRNNLQIVRFSIIAVKVSACGAYVGSLVLFYHLGTEEQLTRKWSTPLGAAMFALIVICGCIQNLSGVALSVAIERDWVTIIAQGSSEHLTLINTYMRRIDLLCKLLAPLFVSLLTSVTSNVIAAYCLCGVEAGCIIFELLWIDIVYRRFPSLQAAQAEKKAQVRHSRLASGVLGHLVNISRSYLRDSLSDWREFVQHPIFLSSVSISCLYFTVLSFDGTMISYLKSESYTDPFIAGMRGLNVVAGLLGTMAMPFLERKLGLNIADMLKYVLTMILSRPSQFRTAALTSFVSVVVGATTYLGYVRRERGHILHNHFGDKIPLLGRRRSD